MRLFQAAGNVIVEVAAEPAGLRRLPWAFIIDSVLALAPSVDAHVAGYAFWSQMIVYWLAVAVLRCADGLAIGRNWGMWRRIGIKFAIIIGAELLVSFSTLEACNMDLTSCRAIF